MRIKLDGIEFTLREPHDFAWLGGLDTVFSVYDRQDSGNLLFGVERDGRRRFVKYAGARTLEHEGTPQEAIERLRRAAGVYRAISHPHLISLEEEIECPQGFAAVFPWFEGRGLHEHWTFDRVAKLASGSPYRRYLHLPMEKRLRSLEAVFAFLEYVESIGYVAVDFYDGSIMYDFERDITKICDIDFFTKAPAVNRLGAGYWGTKRLKAPEEYMTGAVIDTVTNVFTLGALILHLFGSYTGDEVKRMSRENAFFPCPADRWTLGGRQYEAACRATRPHREERYGSLREFHAAWAAACQGD